MNIKDKINHLPSPKNVASTAKNKVNQLPSPKDIASKAKETINQNAVTERLKETDIESILNSIYDQAVNGVGKVSPSVEKLASDYVKKHPNKQEAAKAMINNQIIKCTTSGFLTGLGGLITLPVTVPANVSTVLYVQMRMIACTAYMGGFDLSDDQVQTFVYACLAGISVNEIIKKFGVEFGKKTVTKTIEKIPGKVLTVINQKIGFRLLTKFGETGLINLGKMVPAVGGIINGGLDYTQTKIIAVRAYKMFIEHDFSVGESVPEIDDLV